MNQDDVLKELSTTADCLQVVEPNAIEALQNRNSYIARVNYLGKWIDHWYANKSAELFEADPKMPSWKWEILIMQYPEGRMQRLRRQIIKTIELQCSNLRAELIETASERKFTGAL